MDRAEAEREPIGLTGVWGGATSGRPGGRAADGGQGAWSPYETEGLSAFCMLRESHKFAPWLIFDKVIKSHSELKIV